MPPQRSKKKPFKVLYSFPVLFILLVLTISTMHGVFNSYKMHNEQKAKVVGALEDLSALEKRENSLRAENEWLKTSRGQEELFRDQYMVAKEGENVMIITNKDDLLKENSVTTETKNTNFLTKTKEVISGH